MEKEKLSINYKSKDEKMFKTLSLLFGIITIVAGVFDKGILKILLGLLLVFYYSYEKEVYLSKEGIVFTYKGFYLNRKEHYHFKDIDDITILNQRKNCILFIIQEPMAKKVDIDREVLDEAVKYIESVSKIKITFET